MSDKEKSLDELSKDLDVRRAKALGMGGPEKLEKRKKRGVMTVSYTHLTLPTIYSV